MTNQALIDLERAAAKLREAQDIVTSRLPDNQDLDDHLSNALYEIEETIEKHKTQTS